MTNLVPLDQGRANIAPPAKMRERLAAGKDLSSNFSAGVSGGFPVLSIRGGRFHLRMGQDNEVTIPQIEIDIAFVDAAKPLAKAYYASMYTQGNADQPDCWSLDSIRPDPSVLHKQNPTCQDCPRNQFGDRHTPEGKPAKSCTDHRRVVLTFLGELAKTDPQTVLLRVPQSSLRSLRNYVDQLTRNNYEPGGCVTRLGFETGPQISFPKLQFQFVGPLTEQEFATVEELRGSPNTKAMLMGADFANTAIDPNQPSSVNKHVHALQRQPITIDAAVASATQPPTVASVASAGGGFGPGMLQQEEPEEEEVDLVDMGNGEWLNPVTGEVTKVTKAEAEVDPRVVATKDGRFFHLDRKVFVASQFKDAAAAPTVAPVAKEKPVRARARAKPAEPQAQPQAAPQAAQEAQTVAAPPPKPTVVAASPKLEQLLQGLVPSKKNGNA
jgi:hypothetical protein